MLVLPQSPPHAVRVVPLLAHDRPLQLPTPTPTPTLTPAPAPATICVAATAGAHATSFPTAGSANGFPTHTHATAPTPVQSAPQSQPPLNDDSSTNGGQAPEACVMEKSAPVEVDPNDRVLATQVSVCSLAWRASCFRPGEAGSRVSIF